MSSCLKSLPAIVCAIALVALSACGSAASGSPAAAGGAQSWDQLVAAAKGEERVAVSGPVSDDVRKSVTDPFQKAYGITVDYLGLPGAQFVPRITSERAGGKYLWDVYVGGTSTVILNFKPAGAVEPIEPALLLPEIKDPKSWRGGELPYWDANKLGLSYQRVAATYLYVNTKLVQPGDIASWRDLLNPKWKQKIVIARDPRVIGYSQATFQFFYFEKQLGPDYVTALLAQEPKVLKLDDATASQWLSQGVYPICMCSNVEGDKLHDAGLPVARIDPGPMKEGAGVTSSYNNVALFTRPPHPNAAKLFANWLLTKDEQTLMSQNTKLPSTRADVSTQGVDTSVIPQPGWVQTDTEEVLLQLDKLEALVTAALGK